jgi:hypothetical protein
MAAERARGTQSAAARRQASAQQAPTHVPTTTIAET